MKRKPLTPGELRSAIAHHLAQLRCGLPELSTDRNPQVELLVAKLNGRIEALEDVQTILAGERRSFI